LPAQKESKMIGRYSEGSLVSTDGEIMRLFSQEEIDSCFNMLHLRHMKEVFDRVFGDDNERL